MEKFGYTRNWKAQKFMACGYPVIGLLGILAYGIFVVWPSRGDAYRFEFKWWVPLFVIALLVWAAFEIRKFRKALSFSIELSEESIRVADQEARWEEVSQVEYKNGLGENPAIILHTTIGSILKIPGATSNLPQIKGFVEEHAKSASRS